MDPSADCLMESPGHVERICFVGDSQARTLDGRLFTDAARPGVTIMPAVRRTFYFRAQRFFNGNRFDEHMTHWLWELKCIIATRTAPDPTFTPLVFPVFSGTTELCALRRNPESAPLVIGCGGVDLWDIEQELFGQYNVLLDAEPYCMRGLPPYDAPHGISEQRLIEMISERCAPVFAGIRALRASGFEKICLFGMAPPQRQERQGGKPLRLQYASRIAFNKAYAALAPQAGATFIDLWNPLSKDGHRDDRYFEDIEHVNAAGALVMINLVYEALKR